MSSLFDRQPPTTTVHVPAPTPIRRGVNVAVEQDDKGMFWVSRVRNGASAAVSYTRDELVELRARINAALTIEET